MDLKKKSKQDNSRDEILNPSVRTAESGLNEMTTRRPIFRTSGLGPCCAVLSYDACVRLCINSWIKGCREAFYFLNRDCSQLREAFGLNQVLLRSEEEQLTKQPSELASETAAPKSKKCIGKMEVRVRKLKMRLDPPPCCISFFQRTTLCSNSTAYEEMYYCLLKLESSSEEDVIRMQPESSKTHKFLHVDRSDDLIVIVHNSKEQYCGEVLVPVHSVADNPSKKLRWRSLYREPEHELVGNIQLSINYSTSQEENTVKCGSTIEESVAYDFLLEVAMKVQQFQRRNLLLAGPWKWLVNEFASYYGVSDAYAKLRYLSYVMQVATPTEDCLTLIFDFLSSVKRNIDRFSEQRNRLEEIEDQVGKILPRIFENYKSLDESSPTGVRNDLKAATGSPPPALLPAVKLYCLLHDISNPETQLKFCQYFQAAAKKRSTRHLTETDEFINNKGASISTSYSKMGLLISSIRKEIHTDIKIHNQNILPSFIDLPNLSAPIYSVDLCSSLAAFLVACPPPGPSPPVIELVIASEDFQRELSSWNINPVNEGVDAKVLFYSYLTHWIEKKRLSLLDKCSGIITQQTTTRFIGKMYKQLIETLNTYEGITSRWPEFSIILEKAIADVEKAISEALESQYADVLAPLKDSRASSMLGKFVQKLRKGTDGTYIVPEELGDFLNSMKWILDVHHSKIESQIQSWPSCTPHSGTAAPGERLNEIKAMLSADFRNYIQALGEKLAENTRVQSATKLKKIIQDSKETVMESDVRSRMQPLEDLLIKTIENLHSVFKPRVFIPVCRSLWDRIGQDVLHFLENPREKTSGNKGLKIVIATLDEIFKSQMQKLLGNALSGEDLEPPPSVMEVRSRFARKF